MPPVKKLIDDRMLEAVKALAPEQALFGAAHNPKRITEDIPLKLAHEDRIKDHVPPMGKIIYCEKGPFLVAPDGIPFRMETGDFYFMKRNAKFHSVPFERQEPFTIIWFMFKEWEYVNLHRSTYHPEDGQRIRDQQKIRIEYEAVNRFDELVQQGYEGKREHWTRIHDELVSLFAYFKGRDVMPYVRSKNRWQLKLLKEVSEYLDAHHHEKIKLADIAARFSYSPAYLDTLFKKEYGVGIIQFVIRQRLNKGSYLLEKTDLNISQVAMECGYVDNSYFSRLFKSTFGITPKEYREKYSC